jgi:hypothetical protein
MRSPLSPTQAVPVSWVPPFSQFMEQLPQRLYQRLTAALLLIMALLCLTGCGATGPDSKLVKQAIALEFGQAQLELSQQLRTQLPKFKIERLAIDEKTPLRIEGLPGFRIQGSYDAMVKFPDQRYHQADNPFDIYLQQQGDADNWRLAVPQREDDSSSQDWKTYLIPSKVANAA